MLEEKQMKKLNDEINYVPFYPYQNNLMENFYCCENIKNKNKCVEKLERELVMRNSNE